MIRSIHLFLCIVAIGVIAFASNAQAPSPSDKEIAEAEKAFDQANALYEQNKLAEALVQYKKALAILPDNPSLLFNTGTAAYLTKDYASAAELWKKLKTVEPLDWHNRAKLVQVYQALGKLPERDAERAELFDLWKKGTPPELKQQVYYCREQFEVKGLSVMVYEHFELKGPRALRYEFIILRKTEDKEDFRISLGSYDFTNAVWRQNRNPKPKDDERLFHLDGYYKWGHSTFDMLFPEPSYDDTRARVIKILENHKER